MITKTQLKIFYTAFLDVGKLGEAKLEEFAENAVKALSSVIKGNWASINHKVLRRPQILSSKTTVVEGDQKFKSDIFFFCICSRVIAR